MTERIPIRNRALPKSPRVFDVTVNESGEIIRYDMQNIKGSVFIDEKEVKRQINEFLKQKIV